MLITGYYGLATDLHFVTDYRLPDYRLPDYRITEYHYPVVILSILIICFAAWNASLL